MNVLISLYKGYGLGDGCQMSAVLRHVRRYRPHWIIDYQAEAGKECVGRGIAHNVFAYGQPYAHEYYDAEVQIILYDTWANWGDRPNTRVSSCLHERFGLGWDAECGRYEIHIREEVRRQAREIVPFGAVGFHYRGDSSPDRKNLSHTQAEGVVEAILSLGKIPLLIDWRHESPLRRRNDIWTTGDHSFSLDWGRDAEKNCAVISQCEAFVGIDSGPGKCASATDTPALIVWTGHHPAPFADPAPNTTHLVPVGYHGLFPVCEDAGVMAFFEQHYHVRQYQGDPVSEIERWLQEVLK